MKITFLGHATFLLEAGGTTLLIDPYDDKVGYPVPAVQTDAVLVSHEHGDHNNVAMAAGRPRVIRGLADGESRPVKESVGGVAISSVPTFHDASQGKERGNNTVFIIDAEGLRVVHLGDLGHPLDEAALRAIGHPDVLMIPVGGRFTIDPAQAHAIISQLRPGIAIPMHYKTEVNAGWPIGDLGGFLDAGNGAKQVGHMVTIEKSKIPAATEIWVMTWR